MISRDLTELALELRNKYGNIPPEKLCDELDIRIHEEPMGTSQASIKGFVLGIEKSFTIVVNSELDENLRRVVIAHEICHVICHCEGRVSRFDDCALLDDTSELEREANIFAAEYLLGDDDVIEALNADLTFFEAAAKLCVPVELLDFKFRVMKQKGIRISEPPTNARNGFLRNVTI